MKKTIISIIVMFLMLNVCLAYAYTVDDPSIINEIEAGISYINGETRNDISNIQYVGNGYLVTPAGEGGHLNKSFTEDFNSFRPVSVYKDDNLDSHSRAGRMDEIIWTNGVYMARSNVYDVAPTSGRVLEKNGYLYILDTNFQLLNRIVFDYYVREMSFIDGVYYIRIINDSFLRANVWSATKDDLVDKVYSSVNLEDWEERYDLQHVPVTNGANVITRKDLNIYTFENDRIGNKIAYEEVTLKESQSYDKGGRQILNVIGEYFHIVDNTSPHFSWFSKDGIYFTKFKINTTSLKNEAGVLKYEFQNAFIKKSDIDQRLLAGDVYVKVNNEILGFETPPVLESDRTLVPMRFLFEKLGAEVTWDETTNTATATLPANATEQIQTFGMAQSKSVSFSINNTTATVNGAAKEMDVPARLINDRTMVPLRFLSENLGYTVTWDEATKTAIIE